MDQSSGVSYDKETKICYSQNCDKMPRCFQDALSTQIHSLSGCNLISFSDLIKKVEKMMTEKILYSDKQFQEDMKRIDKWKEEVLKIFELKVNAVEINIKNKIRQLALQNSELSQLCTDILNQNLCANTLQNPQLIQQVINPSSETSQVGSQIQRVLGCLHKITDQAMNISFNIEELIKSDSQIKYQELMIFHQEGQKNQQNFQDVQTMKNEQRSEILNLINQNDGLRKENIVLVKLLQDSEKHLQNLEKQFQTAKDYFEGQQCYYQDKIEEGKKKQENLTQLIDNHKNKNEELKKQYDIEKQQAEAEKIEDALKQIIALKLIIDHSKEEIAKRDLIIKLQQVAINQQHQKRREGCFQQ